MTVSRARRQTIAPKGDTRKTALSGNLLYIRKFTGHLVKIIPGYVLRPVILRSLDGPPRLCEETV
jgi:hypothetical protein